MSHQEPKDPSKALIAQLKDAGLKATLPRMQLTELLLSFEGPFTADEVIAKVDGSGLKIHRATIYRDLAHFVEAGVLRSFAIRTNTANYYELITDSHHHHFICEDCLKMTDVYLEEVEAALETFEAALTRQGLEVDTHTLKFYGRCQTCSTRKKPHGLV